MCASQQQPEDPRWALVTFEAHRRERLQRWAKLPFAKKIENLEEMQRIADALRNAASKKRPIVEP